MTRVDATQISVEYFLKKLSDSELAEFGIFLSFDKPRTYCSGQVQQRIGPLFDGDDLRPQIAQTVFSIIKSRLAPKSE
jgi:hypothetical protein